MRQTPQRPGRSLVALALVAAVAACQARGEPRLRVLAAASLQGALAEAAAAYEKAHPGTTVETAFGGSQLLRAQIEQGARADVFVGADREHAAALVRAGLLGPTRVLARNRLAVVATPGEGRVRGLDDLAAPGVRIVVAAPAVPAGRYTDELLAKLGRARGQADFADRVRANVMSEETNVRAVLAKVRLGEADAGFVYATDAAEAGKDVRVLALPDAGNVVAEYPIGVVTRAEAKETAGRFVDFLLGDAGQAILRRHGFVI
jgi:molybdate transport system substrate-binding protein